MLSWMPRRKKSSFHPDRSRIRSRAGLRWRQMKSNTTTRQANSQRKDDSCLERKAGTAETATREVRSDGDVVVVAVVAVVAVVPLFTKYARGLQSSVRSSLDFSRYSIEEYRDCVIPASTTKIFKFYLGVLLRVRRTVHTAITVMALGFLAILYEYQKMFFTFSVPNVGILWGRKQA
jgi:hypothetical protein